MSPTDLKVNNTPRKSSFKSISIKMHDLVHNEVLIFVMYHMASKRSFNLRLQECDFLIPSLCPKTKDSIEKQMERMNQKLTSN